MFERETSIFVKDVILSHDISDSVSNSPNQVILNHAETGR